MTTTTRLQSASTKKTSKRQDNYPKANNKEERKERYATLHGVVQLNNSRILHFECFVVAFFYLSPTHRVLVASRPLLGA